VRLNLCFVCKGERHPGSPCPGSNSVQGGRDGKTPGKSSNAYAGAMSVDFVRVSGLKESADGVTSLDEIGCGSMAVNHCDLSEEGIMQNVLRDKPDMSNDIYPMAISHELVEGQALFGYNYPEDDEPPLPCIPSYTVYVNLGDSIEDTLGYTIYNPHYAGTTFRDWESYDSDGFDLVAWYAWLITALCDECFGLTNEEYKYQNGGCLCGTESGSSLLGDGSNSEPETEVDGEPITVDLKSSIYPSLIQLALVLEPLVTTKPTRETS
jgi:hypothetical protein